MDNIKISQKNTIVGINWGAIKEKGWFGASGYTSVDLDINLVVLNASNETVTEHNWKNKETETISISRDDNIGDININDKLDNEYAEVSLEKVSKNRKVAIFVNNYTEQELGKLLHFDYRIYDGESNNPKNIFYSSDLTRLTDFSNSFGVFLGILYNLEGEWYYLPTNKCLFERSRSLDEINRILNDI